MGENIKSIAHMNFHIRTLRVFTRRDYNRQENPDVPCMDYLPITLAAKMATFKEKWPGK